MDDDRDDFRERLPSHGVALCHRHHGRLVCVPPEHLGQPFELESNGDPFHDHVSLGDVVPAAAGVDWVCYCWVPQGKGA